MEDRNKSNAGMGLGIAGLVLGILSVPFGIMGCTFATGMVLGILGITLSSVGLSQARKANSQTGLIIAALVISIVGTSFAFIRMTTTVTKSKEGFEILRHKFKNFEEHSDDFEEAFKEGYESEINEDMEETLEDLEEDIDIEINIDEALEGLTDEEKARRLGKAAGKALKGFSEGLKDTTESK
ncbi:MAG: DUF4190 domain-containing protein [Bacteroidales bacterium]|nr:DUF4190 domain-containing protein [Bacteroidales bacterium]